MNKIVGAVNNNELITQVDQEVVTQQKRQEKLIQIIKKEEK